MICILCGWLQSQKISLAPTSGWFLLKFLQTFRAMSKHAYRVCSDQPPLTLSNRCLKLFGQWHPCFLRYTNVLIDTRGPLDQDTAYQFTSWSDQRLPSYSCFYVFQCYSATKWQSCTIFFYLTKDWAHTHVYRVWWRYLIPFKSYASINIWLALA